MEPEQPSTGGDSSAGGGWVFPALLAIVLLVAMAVAQLRPRGEPKWSPAPQPQGETVALTIDFGNGARQQFEALPWHKGLTVEKLMHEAAAYRPGLHFTQHGEGEAGFLQSIEGLKNQGGSGGNWTYEVNGHYAERGFGLQKLEPGDRVLWKFVGGE